MTGKNFFSSRLTGNNLDSWNVLSVDEQADNEHLLKPFSHFCQMDRSMLFASYLGDTLVGLAAVYLAREDKSAVLAGIRVHQKYRESSTKQVIRSSLPLFATANIQNVVAAVVDGNESTVSYFPLTNFLYSWSRGALEDLGFTQIGEIYHCTIRNISNSVEISSTEDDEYEHSKGMELIGRIRKQGEMVPSNDLLGLDIGISNHQLVSIPHNDDMKMLFTHANLGNEIIFPVFLTDPGISAISSSDFFQLTSKKSDIDTLYFPSIRDSQIPILRDLASKLEGELVVNSLALMKKNL